MKNLKKIFFTTPLIATSFVAPVIASSCDNMLTTIYGKSIGSGLITEENTMFANHVYKFRFDLSYMAHLSRPFHTVVFITYRDDFLSSVIKYVSNFENCSLYVDGKLLTYGDDFIYGEYWINIIADLPINGQLEVQYNCPSITPFGRCVVGSNLVG